MYHISSSGDLQQNIRLSFPRQIDGLPSVSRTDNSAILCARQHRRRSVIFCSRKQSRGDLSPFTLSASTTGNHETAFRCDNSIRDKVNSMYHITSLFEFISSTRLTLGIIAVCFLYGLHLSSKKAPKTHSGKKFVAQFIGLRNRNLATSDEVQKLTTPDARLGHMVAFGLQTKSAKGPWISSPK